MSNSIDQTFNAPRVLWAMAFISMVATLLVNGMPVVVGTLGEAYAIPNDQLGLLASGFLTGQFVVVCSSIFWVRRVNWRRTSLIGIASSLVLLVVLILKPSHSAFTVSFALLGATMACFYVPVLAYWSDADDPSRAVSIGILLQVLGASLFMFVVPAWLAPRWGVKGLVGFLIGALVLSLIVAPLIPNSGRQRLAKPKADSTPNIPFARADFLPLAGLTIMALYHVGLFGLWAFMGRIGGAHGLTTEATASALSVSLLAGSSAMVLTSIIGDRFGYIKPMILSGALYVAFLTIMPLARTPVLFLPALILFNLAWNGALPYQIGIIAKADSGGRYFVLLPAFQAAGAAAGPYAAGLLSVDGNYRSIYLLFVGSALVSFIGFSAIATRMRLVPSAQLIGAQS